MAKPLSLPEPRDEILERSPLSLVVCQVRHQVADSPEKFQGSIKDEVLGPFVGSVLSPSITSTHNSVDLKYPGDIYLKLQHV